MKKSSVVSVIRRDLRKSRIPGKKEILSRFFKTKKGEYGEGDVFLGVMVPDCRRVAHEHASKATLSDCAELLSSAIHEERLAALLILVRKFKWASREKDEAMCAKIFDFYLSHTQGINNWDLVDLSAYHIVGAYLRQQKNGLTRLSLLARDTNMWRRRIGIVATYAYIREGNVAPTFTIARILLSDTHDLIHKATGWMLREAGKRDRSALEAFLLPHYRQMPRTMLRYAIEKFEPAAREAYLKGRV